MTIDLNCDLGEFSVKTNPGNDESVMAWITSANIACGFHAGDPLTIEKTIRLALKHGVAIGAHPGYPDRDNFGRKNMDMPDEELRASLLYQVGALKSMVETLGGKLRHVKPHGALYNKAAVNPGMAGLIVNTIREIDPALIVFGLSGSEMILAAGKAGLAFACEVFADRAYNEDGTLVPRSIPGALLHNPEQVILRAIRMVSEQRVETITGLTIPVRADTICLHGDNENAAGLARELALAIREIGIALKPPGKFIAMH